MAFFRVFRHDPQGGSPQRGLRVLHRRRPWRRQGPLFVGAHHIAVVARQGFKNHLPSVFGGIRPGGQPWCIRKIPPAQADAAAGPVMRPSALWQRVWAQTRAGSRTRMVLPQVMTADIQQAVHRAQIIRRAEGELVFRHIQRITFRRQGGARQIIRRLSGTKPVVERVISISRQKARHGMSHGRTGLPAL